MISSLPLSPPPPQEQRQVQQPGPLRGPAAGAAIVRATAAAIVPTFCACPDGAPNVLSFGEPIYGDDAEDLMRRTIHGAIEPWIREHRAEYALWLAHCRQRRAVDDHPFFIDYAPDERYLRHMKG